MKSLTKVFFALLLAVTIAFGGFQGHANARSLTDVGGVATETQSNPLLGTWLNELGSKLSIESVSEDGNVKGFYETAVSSAGCAKGKFPLVGRTNLPSIGFVVSWTNSESRCSSVTAWSGQLQGDQLVTTWLLTSQTVPSNNWRSTYVNKDTFTRSS
ncbi:avidin/streptavidin family protein [Argonema galeatum]|uniref:avidin/streptavidin family protein n=1 Tax=Argonema galeatum TaxID=2942762 RepID=UPI0020135376|nr:avidin/streptavidin family protein [Argonema galeatum]MCL1466593.1 avidin/streptavidin family protein [Argonema galeatum A003/A1]